MSHLPLRKEKNCLNCGSSVKGRFCSNCGQENTINHPSFHYLFTHFASDLVHYDSGFWKTMKTLLFRPGKIINDYLSGKRKTYVPPVKLYIFVSFIAFFLPHILPGFSEDKGEEKQLISKKFEGIEAGGFKNIKTVAELDSIQNILPADKKIDSVELSVLKMVLTNVDKAETEENKNSKKAVIDLGDQRKIEFIKEDGTGFNFNDKYKNIKSVKEFDSVHNSLPPGQRMNRLFKPMARKLTELNDRGLYDGDKFKEKFQESFVHNLPKALFIYLPIFAFFLWLFHDKKKWFYYDHGVFTLYYFSFILILTILNILIDRFLLASYHYFSIDLVDFVGVPAFIILFAYAFFYFFRSHSRVYQERKIVSRAKSLLLFGINCFFISLILVIYTIFTFMMM